ncbi:hypothetical protein ANCDUO_05754 [Ancylostoma duodenale]|uniref:Uncharacterized protein n=1 Tax=Ancylostoma duodenale TaxID=51022 RepID=A0A0C2D3C8_9BILA|nr:hypothetical protein ANCDUO_05754 [Ancylostoma duodenale]
MRWEEKCKGFPLPCHAWDHPSPAHLRDEPFRYASAFDKVLLLIGSLVAIGTGIGLPMMSIIMKYWPSYVDYFCSSASRSISFYKMLESLTAAILHN